MPAFPQKNGILPAKQDKRKYEKASVRRYRKEDYFYRNKHSLSLLFYANFATKMKLYPMNNLTTLLHQGNYSCVIRQRSEVRTFTSRGISDLFRLYRDEPEFLRGAWMADKVVGKGAAALMVLGGIATVHADIISSPALRMLRNADIDVRFDTEVPYIRNRQGTGWCPVEALCRDLSTPEEMLPRITSFVDKALREAATE